MVFLICDIISLERLSVNMRSRLINGFLLILGCYLIVSFSRDIWGLVEKSREIEKEQLKLDQLKKENLELKKRVAYVQSEEFIEKEARDKLGLARDGEAVVMMPSAGKSAREDSFNSEEQSNWQRWWHLFF